MTTNQNGFYVNGVWVPASSEGNSTTETLKERANVPQDRELIGVRADGRMIILKKSQIVQVGEFERLEDIPSFVYGG